MMSIAMSTDLFGMESIDPLDKNICPRSVVKNDESDEGVEFLKYFYQSNALDAAKGLYLTNVVKRRRLEEQQLELYETDAGK